MSGNSIEQLRVPPHSLEAEQSVLAGILATEGGFDIVADLVSEKDFYREDHRLIFRAASTLHDAGRPIDAITVTEWLDAKGEAERIDGGSYLVEITANLISASSIRTYAEIVQEKAVLRALIQSATDIASSAYHPEGRTGAEILQQAEASLAGIVQTGSAGGGTLTGAQVKAALWEDLERRSTSRETGMKTGLVDLDRKLGGIEPGDLVIIAARPSMGKTALMLNIAEHQNEPVAIFSMETTATKLLRRIVASKGVDFAKLKSPHTMTPDDWERVTAANKSIRDDLHITDVGAMSIGAVELQARHLVRKQGVKLICLDYLQQVTCKAEKRFEEVSEVSRRLQALAKSLKVPIIALSQLRRMDQGNLKPKPRLSDLRESGQLEQDADIVILIHRPEYYASSDRPGQADLDVAKSKDGETGIVTVTWQGQHQRFLNYSGPGFWGAAA